MQAGGAVAGDPHRDAVTAGVIRLVVDGGAAERDRVRIEAWPDLVLSIWVQPDHPPHPRARPEIHQWKNRTDRWTTHAQKPTANPKSN